MKINYRLILSLFFVAFMVSSCGSKKRVVTTKKSRKPKVERPIKKPVERPTKPVETKPTVEEPSAPVDLNQQYITSFKDAAMKEQKLYHIPASITIAQGIIESGSGRSRLATEANNHFGIKCHTGWTGGRIYHDDDSAGECFRKYNDPTYSYRDHSLFLTERKRYAGLFDLEINDYKGWAKGLRKAGYATDPRYPEKLISIIERYELYKYDQIAMQGMVNKRPATTPADTSDSNSAPIVTHKVVAGDTLYGISRTYNISIDDLKRLNNLSSNDLSLGQVLRIK
jgi:flagellum-specific peptidoglycan hydrolase FlgJ